MFFNGFDSVKSVKICQINTSNNVLFKTMSIFIFLVNFCLSIFDLIYTYNPGHVTEKSKQLEWNSFTILKYPKKIWLEGNGLVLTFFRTQLFWNIHLHCIWTHTICNISRNVKIFIFSTNRYHHCLLNVFLSMYVNFTHSVHARKSVVYVMKTDSNNTSSFLRVQSKLHRWCLWYRRRLYQWV